MRVNMPLIKQQQEKYNNEMLLNRLLLSTNKDERWPGITQSENMLSNHCPINPLPRYVMQEY